MIGVASVILVGSAIDGSASTPRRARPKPSAANPSCFTQVINAQSRKEFFDKLKHNHELKLADEHYLELTNGDNILYSAYRPPPSDTKRGNLTSEDTAIIGAEADIAGHPRHDRSSTAVSSLRRKSKTPHTLQLSAMT